MVSNHVMAAVAFLVLACLLAGLVAVARARRKALLPGGFPVENSHPGGQGFRLGGVAGVDPGALAAATTAAAAAASAAVSAFDRLAAAAPSEPAALATAATAAAAAASAAVPVFNTLARVAVADVAASPPVAADIATSAPNDVMFGINTVPQTFTLIGLAGKGGTKQVRYIDQMSSDWVLATPMGEESKIKWPRIVKEELHMTAQLHALGIPCLEMYGVVQKPPNANGYEGLALKMRSFDYYRKTHKTVIFDCNSHDPSHQYMTTTKWSEIINGEADKWLAHGGISYAMDKLLALLAPLAKDIKTLAQNCRKLDVDSRSWQVVFSDDELKTPSQVRVFLFDLASKLHDRTSILAAAGTSASEKGESEREYLTGYLESILPYGGAREELRTLTRARMEKQLPAVLKDTYGLVRPINMGGSEQAYYAVCTRLPATNDVDPGATAYFVFEKICSQNIEFWLQYVGAQNNSAVRMKHPIIKDTNSVLRSLELFKKKCSDVFDVWVAYVSSEMPTVFADRGKLNYVGVSTDNTGIEMAVSVLVDRETPITTHTGTFRPLKHWRPMSGDEKAQYVKINYTDKGLSVPRGLAFSTPVGRHNLTTLCHAFAAAAARTAYAHLRSGFGTMVTRSASKMGKMLITGLSGQEYTVGSPGERSQEIIESRAERGADLAEYPSEHEDHEDYSPEVYAPRLGVQYTPFFVAGDAGMHTVKLTFRDDSRVYKEPEWLQEGNPCKYNFDPADKISKHAALEYAIRLSGLERVWMASTA